LNKEAILYDKLPGNKVRCTACARYCEIKDGQIGLCGIRGNVGGKLDLFVYGKVITGNVDPIEKKPVIHYRPGTKIFSIATTGCNWLCQPKGTKVLMANGSKKPIERIKTGDKIWSYDVDGSFGIVPNVVTHTGSRFAELLEIRYGSRERGRLYLTKEHPVFTTDGWKPAESLQAGDKILKVWYQNTKVWNRKRSNSIQEAKFSCKNCDQVIVGINEWNRHRGICHLKEYETPQELRTRYSASMKTNNPMFNPNIARKSHETGKANFIKDPSHGWHKNAERLRKWLHKHPSESRKLLYDLLDKIGIKYEKEYRIKIEKHTEGSKSFYIADAAILEAKLDIEIDGWWHHDSEKIQQTDKIRDKSLAVNGWRTIRISGRQIYSHPNEVESFLLEYISPLVRKNKKTWMDIKKVKNLGKTTRVFSFECIPNHNYVGDGILLHNCKYCQNYDISQRRKVEGTDMTPEQVAQMAVDSGSHGIAYTYNQPSIFIEFARDCGIEAHKRGLFNIFVSNGYDTPQTVKMMGEFLDCITVDFKGSAEPDFTRKYIGVPDPKPIFDTLLEIRDKTKIHVEITDLIVPQVGDSLEHAKKLSKFLYDEFGPEMPIHFLRFHPDYKMMEFPPTPVKTLEKHYEVAKKEGLEYVYLGNVPGHPYEHTYCPGCKNIAVGRYGFDIMSWNLDEHNKCNTCGKQIPIIGQLDKNYKKNRFQFVV
jgi:pyruvate formate lyase activating enzyme